MERFIPTNDSLNLSQKLAEEMGLSFDKESVKKLAINLHGAYFGEIISKLDMASLGLNFKQGSLRKIAAFAGSNNLKTVDIFFDELFDFWLMNMCFCNSVAAFKVLNQQEFVELEQIFESSLDLFANTYQHELIRDRFLPLKFQHLECLRFGHDLSKAMITFVLCHEIAHVSAGHLSKKSDVQFELEADLLAIEYYDTILSHPNKSGYLSFGEDFLGAPIILFNYFSVSEKRLFTKTRVRPTRKSHPNPMDRVENISPYIEAKGTEKAKYILNGFLAGLEDLVEHLALPKHI